MSTPARPRRSALRRREAIQGYLFVAPWIIGFLVFVLGPMLFSLYASFTNYDVTSRFDFIGLENYRNMLADPTFWVSLGNTAFYAVFAVPLGVAVALLVAMLLNQDVPGQRIFRTIFFMPKVLTGVAVLLLWLWVFNPQVGPINAGLVSLGVQNPPLWFADPQWAKPALIIMSVWGAVGSFVIFLGGLQAVPKDLYEAAQIDGASPWRQFWSVTIPMISPLIFFKLITGITAALQFWSEALIITKGGPGQSTLFYGLYLWNTAFTELRMGYASAMAWVLLLLTLIITLVQFQLSKRWVHYEGEAKP